MCTLRGALGKRSQVTRKGQLGAARDRHRSPPWREGGLPPDCCGVHHRPLCGRVTPPSICRVPDLSTEVAAPVLLQGAGGSTPPGSSLALPLHSPHLQNGPKVPAQGGLEGTLPHEQAFSELWGLPGGDSTAGALYPLPRAPSEPHRQQTRRIPGCSQVASHPARRQPPPGPEGPSRGGRAYLAVAQRRGRGHGLRARDWGSDWRSD